MSKTLPIAVQVYSVREEAERDFAGTMKKLGEMGYDGVELAGLYGKSAEEIRDSIKAAGLTAISAHVSYDELAGDLEKTLQDYEIHRLPLYRNSMAGGRPQIWSSFI